MPKQQQTYLKTINQADDLWEELRQGNKEAYFLIYQEHVDELFNYGFKIRADRELVQDCLQDLFVNLWEKRSSLGKVQSIQFYLFASLRRMMLRVLKKRNLESFGDEAMFELFTAESHEMTLISKQETAQRRQHLKQAIKQLSTRQREVIFLKFYDNFSYDEISRIMEISVESLYKLVSKALKVLKHLLQERVIFFLLAAFHLMV